MRRTLQSALAVLLLIPVLSTAHGQDTIAVTCDRLSDRAAVFRTAVGSEPTNVIALQSERGIVIIDTERSPVFTTSIRTVIEEEFDGDIRYLINTHGHGDHTYGNQVFSEATIIAHENCVQEIEEAVGRIDGTVEQISAMIPRWKSQLEGMEEGSEQAVALAATISYYEQMVAGLAEGFTVTFPTLTFKDRMNLDLGDLTLELVWYGRAHSNSDIIIYCPEERLLLTGDLFHTHGMPYIDSERIPHLSRWHGIIDTLLKREEGITNIVCGHGVYLPLSNLEETLSFIAGQRELYAGRESTLNTFRAVIEAEGVEAGLVRLREMYADTTRY